VEETDRQYFEVLKKKIAEVMLSTHAGISQNFEDWKGNNIQKFQEDLNNRVNAYISEKSFYNHFKSVQDKLPRIDMLNILSRYSGYTDWAEFKTQNSDKIIQVSEYKGSNKILYWIPVAAVITFVSTLLLIKAGSMATYTFCLQDRDTHEPITAGKVDVFFRNNKLSPSYFTSDSDGCFQLKTGEQTVQILPRVPFYAEDTLMYKLFNEKATKIIQLKAQDYALMLYYFANSKVENWQLRREKLHKIISDSAYICQVYRPRMAGVELYNKAEFIELLTMPTGSLKNLKILEVLYQKDKITTIRFTLDAP